MNQLAIAEKRFPRSHPDIAADYFALRKTHNGNKWAFKEGLNSLNPASHCDIAWAGALATFAHANRKPQVFAATIDEYGNVFTGERTQAPQDPEARIQRLLLSDDPRIWRRLA
jgi:hypothetical protein